MAKQAKKAAPRPAAPARPAARPKSPSAAKKEPVAPLPSTIIAALPSSKDAMVALAAFSKSLPKIKSEMAQVEKRDAIALARAFVVLHRMQLRIAEAIKPLSDMFAEYKNFKLPEAFERDHVTSIPLAEGYRVGVSAQFRASIRPEFKDEAYEWLENNGFEDLISRTVNAGTLSSTAKQLLDEKGKELPEKLFNVALIPNTSVTTTK